MSIKINYNFSLSKIPESNSAEISLAENIEYHPNLNPILYKNNKLVKTVRKSLLNIVNQFEADLLEKDLKLPIKDIIIIGSNADYNYTGDSDIDLHILIDLPEESKQLLFLDEAKMFNNRYYQIRVLNIPVEIYVEDYKDYNDLSNATSGVYSLTEDRFLVEPMHLEADDVTQDILDKVKEKVSNLTINYYNNYLQKIENNLLLDRFELGYITKDIKNIADISVKSTKASTTNSKEKKSLITTLIESISKEIDDLYEARQAYYKSNNISDIEGNLIFKEIRNLGWLDFLKEAKNKLIRENLSLN